jgi:glycerate dehydrogenase
VDTRGAEERGIQVTNVPAYSTMSVAQLVFAHLLNLTHHVGHHAGAVRDGRWSAIQDFAFWDFPLIELNGLALGIVGFGRIGKAVTAIARSFGMNVLVHTRNAVENPGVAFVPLDEIFSQSDILSLHCPLTEQTRGLVTRDRLSMMKRSAWIINTSRGPLIDEQALADALHNGIIAGAGLDVLSVEPPPPDHPLLAAPNCFVTPHIAWATTAARRRLMDEAVENIRSFLRGEPRNVVNDL